MAVVNAEAQLERSLTDKHVYTADGSSTSSLVSLSHTQTNLTEKQLTEQLTLADELDAARRQLGDAEASLGRAEERDNDMLSWRRRDYEKCSTSKEMKATDTTVPLVRAAATAGGIEGWVEVRRENKKTQRTSSRKCPSVCVFVSAMVSLTVPTHTYSNTHATLHSSFIRLPFPPGGNAGKHGNVRTSHRRLII